MRSVGASAGADTSQTACDWCGALVRARTALPPGQGASPTQCEHRWKDVRAAIENNMDELDTMLAGESPQPVGLISVSRNMDLDVP